MPVPCEASSEQRGEAAVARRGVVSAAGLEMVQEGEVVLGMEVVEAHAVDLATHAVSEEKEEKPHRIAVGPQGVRARSAHARQMLTEERLQERGEVGGVGSCHWMVFRKWRRARRRRPAMATSSGVAAR